MRLFFETNDLDQTKLRLTPDRFHYLSRVRRLQRGESLSVIIGHTCYTIKVLQIDPDYLYFESLSHAKINSASLLDITVIQCLPKQDKMDTIVNYCTQLGVSNIYPIESQRSIVKWPQHKKDKKRDRWTLISRHASEQSHQLSQVAVHPIQSLSSFCTSFKADRHTSCIVPWESEISLSLKEHLSQIVPLQCSSIALFIGPEGGISIDEILQLRELGFITISLGDAIYRTEIAALITLSQLHFYFS